MGKPWAINVEGRREGETYSISVDANDAERLIRKFSKISPAVIFVKKTAILTDMSVAVFDEEDVLAVTPGSWDRAIMVVRPDSQSSEQILKISSRQVTPMDGDSAFLHEVGERAPMIFNLADEILDLIRSNGISGVLKKSSGGKWVNYPINSFTLRVQPKVKNFQFTIFGNPEYFEEENFLKKDQNGYSRGWIKNSKDAEVFVNLARQSHERKLG